MILQTGNPLLVPGAALAALGVAQLLQKPVSLSVLAGALAAALLRDPEVGPELALEAPRLA